MPALSFSSLGALSKFGLPNPTIPPGGRRWHDKSRVETAETCADDLFSISPEPNDLPPLLPKLPPSKLLPPPSLHKGPICLSVAHMMHMPQACAETNAEAAPLKLDGKFPILARRDTYLHPTQVTHGM